MSTPSESNTNPTPSSGGTTPAASTPTPTTQTRNQQTNNNSTLPFATNKDFQGAEPSIGAVLGMKIEKIDKKVTFDVFKDKLVNYIERFQPT